jgi:hypothetical protein
VFGDFEISSAPAEEPSPVLGWACEPGAYRCSNELLERCNDDRSAFVVEQVCASAAECNLNARTCRPCVSGEYMCRGKQLERCNADSTWMPEGDCESEALCFVSYDRLTGRCNAPLPDCQAGLHSCQGPKLVRCSDGRDRFDVVALCENQEHCDPAYANELVVAGMRGACRPAACEPNEFRCTGATLEHCAMDRTSFGVQATCESPDLCNAALGACMACVPDAVECNGREVRRCSAAGSWQTVATCESAVLCDDEAGRCLEAECTQPGSLRCSGGAVPVLEVCSDGLTWEVAETCASNALCSVSAGRCLPPACEPDEVRCQDYRRERCSGDLTRWELVEPCVAGTVCSPEDGCVPGPCVEESVRCNGASLERCVSGNFEEIARCETAALCDAVGEMCREPVCTEPFVCSGAIIRGCNPGKDGYVEVRTCPAGNTCDPSPAIDTGQPQCDICVADTYECSGADLMRCSSDGQRREKVATCPTRCDAATIPPTCM